MISSVVESIVLDDMMEEGPHDDDQNLDHDTFSSPEGNDPIYDLGKDVTFHSGITDTGIHSSALVKNIKRKSSAYNESVNAPYIILPWNKWYKTWWSFLVVCAAFTAFFESYEIAFAPAGLAPYDDAASVIDYVLMAIFSVDIIVHFNLAYYDSNEELVYDRKQVAAKYIEKMFWIDVIGVFPFYEVVLAITGELGQDSRTAQYLAMLRLLRLVRLHRVKRLFEIIHYSTRISLMTLTLIRNFVTALVWTHVAACIFYFIARQYSFDADQTWLGDEVLRLSAFERYVTTLYWSIVTFTTVGYGDWSPVNSVEQIWGMIYMLINIVIQSWIIGSITLLVVKNDEKTGNYRDTLETLNEYCKMHSFPKDFKSLLKTQLKLDFDNQEVADENVLQHFPISVRRKVLRQLYLPYLNKTKLMGNVRQQFIDEFLTTCKVEIYSPGEDIIERNTISSHLYLLVEGVVELGPFEKSNSTRTADDTTVDDSTVGRGGHRTAGEFINPFSFFTESHQIETVRTKTICKTLTMSRSDYKLIAQDHPGSSGKIMQNLLEMSKSSSRVFDLPQPLSRLRAGSMFFNLDSSSQSEDVSKGHSSRIHEEALTKIQDLVKMHIAKQKDDHTTKFLLAASRGDLSTISIMCDQGFDPNSSDYDYRTALMVASMRGNMEVVGKLLEYNADPNLRDMHGATALYEAAKNGNDDVMDELMKSGAELCMTDEQAASTLCQAVYNGHVLLLKRLLKAKINVNASDYDKRTAAHIAAAEGNVSALKVLVDHGADKDAKDRWGKTAMDAAKDAKATLASAYLSSLSWN